MAAATAMAIIGGIGLLAQVAGQQQQKKAAKMAGKLNAQDAEINARLAMEKALEDEKQFRLSFRRDTGANIAAIGASGVRMEGSPLEVLRDNSAGAEADALNIRRGGEQQRDSYLRQASAYRAGAAAVSQAANTQSAATLLSSGSQLYSNFNKAGG